ncbi:MAG: CDP-alcohol phosphatidyltransferase family protein [Acidobacteriaceae bacterium]|nr:CDP-alcohol phosphatidyltransferase family protein [Acidobacteriaceae bacterium]
MPSRVIPHLITCFRLLCSPIAAWLLFQSRYRTALGVVFLAGISDWFDGFAARRLRSSGHAGVVLDPLADKILLVTLFVVLAIRGLIPAWMFWIALGRDLVIVIGALLVHVLRGIREFLPSTLGKVSTFFQIMLILLTLCVAAFPYGVLLWLKYTALASSAFFTALSGLDYVRLGVEIARRRRIATG